MLKQTVVIWDDRNSGLENTFQANAAGKPSALHYSFDETFSDDSSRYRYTTVFNVVRAKFNDRTEKGYHYCYCYNGIISYLIVFAHESIP